jgi:hydrogenase maturation factor
VHTRHEARLAQATANQDVTHRTLAEALAATRKAAEAQERITAELVEIRNRVAAIEKLLNEVV